MAPQRGRLWSRNTLRRNTYGVATANRCSSICVLVRRPRPVRPRHPRTSTRPRPHRHPPTRPLRRRPHHHRRRHRRHHQDIAATADGLSPITTSSSRKPNHHRTRGRHRPASTFAEVGRDVLSRRGRPVKGPMVGCAPLHPFGTRMLTGCTPAINTVSHSCTDSITLLV